jgi:circadian clock protein KaiC
MDLRPHLEAGTLRLQRVDPAAMSAGQFSAQIRQAVEDEDVRAVVIDSVTGYLHAMPNETELTLLLHELLTFLAREGVISVLVSGQHGLIQETPATRDLDMSYLADSVVLLRYYEHRGEVRKAISVFKHRGGKHERTIRDFSLDDEGGIVIGEPLRQFRGVLSGVPEYERNYPSQGE